MISVTLDQLRALAPTLHLSYIRAADSLDEVLARFEISATPLRLAHFFAQVLHESGGFRVFEEDLTYRSAARIRAVFGAKRFPTLAAAEPFVNNPIALARKVYGGRMGNTVTNDDGWNFRGRGPLQLTGRENYQRFGKLIGVDLIADPGLVNDRRSLFAIPAAYWNQRACNAAADRDDLEAVTKLVNGGLVGLSDRAAWLKKTKAVFAVARG